MRRSRLAAIALACAALVAALVGASGATASKPKFPTPDKSLNGRGWVDLSPLTATPKLGPDQSLEYAPTPSGAVWIGSRLLSCISSCSRQPMFSRLNSNGQLLEYLGQEGLVPFAASSSLSSVIGSDGQGRLITVTAEPGGQMTVRRFLSTGLADPSFGSAGVATFNCGCRDTNPQMNVAVDPQGRIVLAIDSEVPPAASQPSTTEGLLVRLLPSGQVDSKFGRGGFIRLASGIGIGRYFSPAGGIFLINYSFSKGVGEVTVERFSKMGALDTRFDAKANKAIAQFETQNGLRSQQVKGMVFRPKGRFDLIWLNSGDGSIVQRLGKDGSTETKFGTQGAKHIGQSIEQALPMKGGYLLALGFRESDSSAYLVRLTPDYALDKSFGKAGSISLPEVLFEEGVSMTPASGGRVTVVDRGNVFCRSACQAMPKLYRYRVEPAK